jgi:F-type H+-transporting ATPase subunit b
MRLSTNSLKRGGPAEPLARRTRNLETAMAQTWMILAAEEGGDFTDINLVTALWTWVAFGVTYLVLRTVAWPKFTAAIESRELRIAEGLRKAEEAESRAQDLMAQRQRVFDEARREAQQLLAEARAAAEREADALLRSAQLEIAEERKQAKEEVRREQAEALQGLRQAAVDLTLLTTSRLLKRELSDDERRRLARQVIDDVAVAA